ncbi:uncharacterized protein LOC116347455 [Contarinia nasturtii]|uniref:uncharacterized protein LOC116347455 n=1 Tax=Contarinia nasturtii TaxID=265458 RepID=UPI0012D44BB0|nr:uncharacterized protein LOC116347455 [Contarinia nasturtii]
MFSVYIVILICCICNYSSGKSATTNHPNEVLHSRNRNIMQQLEGDLIRGIGDRSFSDDPNLNVYFTRLKNKALKEASNDRENVKPAIDNLHSTLMKKFAQFNHSLEWYSTQMESSLKEFEPLPLSERKILALHQLWKNNTISMFSSRSANDKLKQAFQRKLESSIDDRFVVFQRENKRKRDEFNDNSHVQISTLLSDLMALEMEYSNLNLNNIELIATFGKIKNDTLEKIYIRLMDDDEFVSHENIKKFFQKFEKVAGDFLTKLLRLLELCYDVIQKYDEVDLQRSFDPCLENMHTSLYQKYHHFMENTLETFLNQTNIELADGIKESFKKQIKKIIDNKYQNSKQQIVIPYLEKCALFKDPANLKHKAPIDQIKRNFEIKMLEKIQPQADLSYTNLSPEFETYKIESLTEFKSIEFGNENISQSLLTYLTNYFNFMQTTIIQASDSFESSLENYRNLMDASIDEVRIHLTDNDFENQRDQAKKFAIIYLKKIHLRARNPSIKQFISSIEVDSVMFNRFTEVLIEELDRCHSILDQMLTNYEKCLEDRPNSTVNFINETFDAFSYYYLNFPYLQTHQEIIDESAKQADWKKKCKEANDQLLTFKVKGSNVSKLINITVNLFKKLVSKTKKYHLQTNMQLNWFRANIECLNHNMRLASFSSREEVDQVEKQIRDAGFGGDGGTFWTAGTKLGNDNKFYWMGHDKEFAFTNWGDKEPNDFNGKESCVEMVEYHNLKWNDWICDWERYFICEES